jgi:hypothetical protein
MEVVELSVGPGKKIFRVHKAILCDKLPYFAKMFNGSFKEGQDLKASFPEDSPQSFDILLGWIYFGKIRRISTKAAPRKHLWNAFDAYGLGDKLCVKDFMDSVIDIYINWLATAKLYPHAEMISEGFEKTPRGSPFQRFLCHLLHFVIVRAAYCFNNLSKVVGVHKVLGTNEDLRLDLLVRMMSHPPGSDVEDPTKLERCKFHQHGENEPCTQKKVS